MGYDPRIELAVGDITKLAVDAIVNAANRSLLGGGGVDGAIHRAAGPGLLAECHGLGGCPTGEARLTSGHDLPARFVIHTVGPVWRGGGAGEDGLLARCYGASLALAVAHDVRSIAFPAISTGVYGFPRPRACAIAVNETQRFLLSDNTLERVILISFDGETAALYRRELASPNRAVCRRCPWLPCRSRGAPSAARPCRDRGECDFRQRLSRHRGARAACGIG